MSVMFKRLAVIAVGALVLLMPTASVASAGTDHIAVGTHHIAVAKLFRGTAQVELQEHFAAEAVLAGWVAGNAANLRDAIAGETYEHTTMYPGFATQATADNCPAAAGQLSAVACVANPGYIVVCSYVSPAMASRKLAALPATNPASTASAAKCSCSSTWAVPRNSLATAMWWVPTAMWSVPADATEAVGMRSTRAPTAITASRLNMTDILPGRRQPATIGRLRLMSTDGISTSLA